MIDCSNAEIRDLLPDYVRGTLSGESLRRLEAHISGCAPCSEESELLRCLARAMSSTPAINVEGIVAALPPSPGLRPRLVRTERAPRLRLWHSQPWLRVAAGFVIVAGTATLYLSRPAALFQPASVTAVAASRAPSATPAAVVALAPTESVPSGAARATAELRLGIAHDLSDAELRGLLEEIDAMKGVPAAESEDFFRGLVSSADEGD